MGKRILSGLALTLPGYVAGAALGYFLVESLSPNRHDRAVEAAMTGFLLVGPVVALGAFVVGFVRAGRKSSQDRSEEA